MHVYQGRSTDPVVVADSKERMRKCMDALKEVSKVWIVAKMVHALFESILGNKALEERLQKSTGSRHHSKKITPTILAEKLPVCLQIPVPRSLSRGILMR
jgi:hypothetical protein